MDEANTHDSSWLWICGPWDLRHTWAIFWSHARDFVNIKRNCIAYPRWPPQFMALHIRLSNLRLWAWIQSKFFPLKADCTAASSRLAFSTWNSPTRWSYRHLIKIYLDAAFWAPVRCAVRHVGVACFYGIAIPRDHVSALHPYFLRDASPSSGAFQQVRLHFRVIFDSDVHEVRPNRLYFGRMSALLFAAAVSSACLFFTATH